MSQPSDVCRAVTTTDNPNTGAEKCVNILELKTKAIRRFAKVSIVSYGRPSLIIIASASQFHIHLPWGQHPFSIVS